MKSRPEATSPVGGRKLPGYLYPTSVLWGALMGVVYYASGTFPIWYTRDFFERPQRGPFWDYPNLVLSVLVMTALSSAYFAVMLRSGRAGGHLGWTYLAASILLPSFSLTVGVIWSELESPARYLPASLLVWLIHGIPILLCTAPYGLLSGLLLNLVVKRSAASG